MLNKPTLLFVNMRRIEKERIESIMAAKKLGYDIVLLTNTIPNHYFQSFFKYIEIVDTFNLAQSLAAAKKLAKQYSIVGVPSWTEIDIELVAHICASLNLPGLPIQATTQARNKFAMKKALADNPELLPQFVCVNRIEELKSAIEQIGLPAVIKPTGASGSKGIFVLNNRHDTHAAFNRLKEIAQPAFDPVFRQYGAEFIVEEYLDGEEFSVEGFITDNQVHVIGITDKWTTYPYHLEYQHIFPSKKPENIQQEIKDKTAFIVKKLGFNNCAFHLEAKITSKGFRFIEVAARLGGDYINSHLVRISTGINMFENLIRVAVGQQPILHHTNKAISGVRYILAQHAGQLVRLDGLAHTLQHPFLEYFMLEMPINSQIKLPPEHFGNMRLAAFVIKHNHYQACETILDEVNQTCIPVIK